MVFVNESELPWDFGHPNRCDSYGHARTARKPLHLHLVTRRISLVSEQARMGWMLRDEHL
jgi:hypothetical protein